MRYIERVPLPDDLAKDLASKTSLKFSLSKEQRKKLRMLLLLSQKSLCCYCECRISEKNDFHIEHFIEQHDNRNLIHDYTNLLLSCYGNTKALNDKIESSCGCNKERDRHNKVEIDYLLLLNPAENNVRLFSYSIFGLVVPSIQCSQQEVDKVNYTTKRLSLNANRLILNRLEQIELIQEELKNLSKEEKQSFITSLLNENKNILTPHYSTIKEIFSFMLNVPI